MLIPSMFKRKGRNMDGHVEYPDGTVEESSLLMYNQIGRVSFVLNGSRDERKYDRKNDELENVSRTARLIKTADRNPKS